MSRRKSMVAANRMAGRNACADHPSRSNACSDEGDGAVAIFSESGKLEPHGVLLGGPHTPLAAPWGVAVAPDNFGQFSGDLLVGNFSFLHSEINAFDPQTHQFEGTIPISAGSGNTPGGLWETHGLFGAIESIPLNGASTYVVDHDARGGIVLRQKWPQRRLWVRQKITYLLTIVDPTTIEIRKNSHRTKPVKCGPRKLPT